MTNALSDLFELFASLPQSQAAVLAFGGKPVAENRDDLLQRSRAGQQIELELDITPFLQTPGVRNRNCLRFREGALHRLGLSGKGTPFLRDHAHGDLLARGGTVISSRLESAEDGTKSLHQTVRLTEPWAVQAALTGSLDRFSIGWNPTGPVSCSACGTEVFASCSHMPGDKLESGEVIEFVFSDAELIETSAVSVPAVKGTSIDDIRAALSAASAHAHRAKEDRLNPRLLAQLGLSEAANDNAVTTAISKLQTERDDAQRALATAEAGRDEAAQALASEREAHEQLKSQLSKQAEDRFIEQGARTGKIPPGSKLETALRRMFQADTAAAIEQLAMSPVINPVGQRRQTPSTEPAVASALDPILSGQLSQLGIADPAEYAKKYGELS